MNQPRSKPEKRFWSRERYLQILALLFTIAISVIIFINRGRIVELAPYGYIGVFLVSLISCSSIVVPVPGWILVATMGAILNPILVGIVSGIGGTIGETTGYLLGYSGRIVTDEIGTHSRVAEWIYSRMEKWMRRWGSLTIFVLALIPNPFFDIAGAAAGLLRFPLWKFFLFGAAGRIPKNILFAYIGIWGSHLLPS